jgi:RHS repeat-associated protein
VAGRRGTQPTWKGTKGYVGGTDDPTGLTHLGARYYDPALGRFLSLDPIIAHGDSQQMHGYAYANNSPIIFSDPTGLFTACTPDGYNFCPGYDVRDQPVAKTTVSTKYKVFAFLRGLRDGGNRYGPDAAKATRVFFQDPKAAVKGIFQQLDFWAYHYDDQFFNSEIAIFCVTTGGCQVFEDWHAGYYYEAGYGSAQLAGDAAFAAAGIALTGGTGALIGGATKAPRLLNIACSFTEDTEVLLADGSTVTMGEIAVGDLVWATDPETGHEGPRPVLAVWTHQDTVFDLELDGGATITTTEDHPFWNHTDRQWQRADTLNPDDYLLAPDGTTITVTALHWHTTRTETAYNLTIANIHTYYVLADQTALLVHNTCGAGSPEIPTGSRGNKLHTNTPNAPAVINGRSYSGHALDRMQQQGIMPSVVEEATLRTGVPGKVPGTTSYYDNSNDLTVITDTSTGRVITVDYGLIKQ